jgi:glutaredoxin
LERIKIYVYSFEISTLDFVDKEGALHACAQAGSGAFSGLRRYSGVLDKRYLCEKDRTAIVVVEGFCKEKGVDYEIVDVATVGYLNKMKYWMRGLRKFPTVAFRGKVFHGVPTEEAIEKLVTAYCGKTLD